MKKLLLSLCVFTAFSFTANAEEVVTTQSGQQVLLKDDKSWSFIEAPETTGFYLTLTGINNGKYCKALLQVYNNTGADLKELTYSIALFENNQFKGDSRITFEDVSSGQTKSASIMFGANGCEQSSKLQVTEINHCRAKDGTKYSSCLDMTFIKDETVKGVLTK